MKLGIAGPDDFLLSVHCIPDDGLEQATIE
jgi:hypothetical protein